MVSKKRSFLASVSYTLSSNLTSFIINALILLIVPKLVGSTEYGYFQYYTLLVSYTAYFHLGICNGITLKDSGKAYNTLDKRTLSSQHSLLGAFSVICVILIQLLLVIAKSSDANKSYALLIAPFMILCVNSRVFSTTVLLASSRFKEYSHIIIIERVLYAVFLSVVLLLGIRDFKILILSDVIGKVFAALLGIYYCHDIIFAKSIRFKQAWIEFVDNFKIGVLILITNLASILITGIIQFLVENKWDIETFGKVSLSFNISKMLMLVINAVSAVLLPFLKNLKSDELPKMYEKIRLPLMTILIVLLLLFYPLQLILQLWLPQYKESIFFASLLFPMCLFESKTAMLINTYLKALRKEKWLCLANVLVVVLTGILSMLTVYVFENLMLTVLLIPILFAVRCTILEYPLAGLLKISVMKDAFIEIAVATIFIAVNYFLPAGIAFTIYLIVVVIYIFTHRKSLKEYVKIKRNKIPDGK